jgi:MFS family permease
MYSDEDLISAVQAGVLTEQNASAFRSHVAQLRKSPAVDEEHFRLVTGFNDIFVVIACVLLLAAVAWIGTEALRWLGAALQALVAWLLAEFFTRKRRMALPSIVLLLAFVSGVLAASYVLLPQTGLGVSIASVVAAAAAWLHWLRFKVPITVAAGTGALVGASIALLVTALPRAMDWTSAIAFAAGVAVFVIAMRWDASDRLRQTRRSDAAFWLHLLAAPLLVHPVFKSLGVFDGETTAWQATAVVALYVVIGLVSLSIDRRALMVSALAYVLYAFTTLLKSYGVVSLSFAITALAIGSALLLLSAFWHPIRAVVLRIYPHAVVEKLAPLR